MSTFSLQYLYKLKLIFWRSIYLRNKVFSHIKNIPFFQCFSMPGERLGPPVFIGSRWLELVLVSLDLLLALSDALLTK